MLALLSKTPIKHVYPCPSKTEINAIQSQDEIHELCSSENIQILNAYYQLHYPGTHEKVFTRKVVYQRICQVADALKPQAGLLIFDAFRTIETQTFLYQDFFQQIKKKHPKLNDHELDQLTREFVSHPSDKNHFEIPLHNSGGAIDLEIYDIASGKKWDFGTEIDTISELSHTDFFERPYEKKYEIDESRWLLIRKNRRILFHLMKTAGFINFKNEWWHYDIGDCNWANTLNIDWFFESMKTIVSNFFHKL